MFEDSFKNLVTAKSLGMLTVFIQSDTAREEGVSQEQLATVDAVVRDVSVVCVLSFYLILDYLVLDDLILDYLILDYLILDYLRFSYLRLSYLSLSYLRLARRNPDRRASWCFVFRNARPTLGFSPLAIIQFFIPP